MAYIASTFKFIANPVERNLGYFERVLNCWLKPHRYAEPWDNVGLLVGSGKYSKEHKRVQKVLLCIDMSLAVVNEAIIKNIDLIIAYHPPIFVPLRAVAYNSAKEQIIARCLAHDIAVYSPHTALDTVHGGINDFVINGMILESYDSVLPLAPLDRTKPLTHWTDLVCNSGDRVREVLGVLNTNGVHYGLITNALVHSPDVPPQKDESFKMIIRFFTDSPLCDMDLDTLQITPKQFTTKICDVPIGAGRRVIYRKSYPIDEITARVGKIFGSKALLFAYGNDETVNSVAFVAGSGGSVLKEVTADYMITGEMSHHEALAFTEKGISVACVGHSQSERVYLPIFLDILNVLFVGSNISISEEDKDPLRFETVP